MSAKPTVLYLATEDWHFWSHRLAIARAARDAGWRVVVATRVQDHGARIVGEGFELAPLRLRRAGRNPFGELLAIAQLVRVYRAHRPDVVHHIAMKPVLYGSLAARIAGVPAIVNAIVGLGYVFISADLQARLMRPAFVLAMRWLLNGPRCTTLLQNTDDRQALTSLGAIQGGRTVIIRGSGVDTDLYRFRAEQPPGPPVALVASRMLWDKGIGEIVEAARLLRERGTEIVIRLVGEPDPANPATIPEAQLRAWHVEGLVEWLGARDDVPALLAQSHIGLLPSYREGLPKSLLEAASCGLPVVTTDAPGCRELLRFEQGGIMVPLRDAAALADALDRLARDPELRRRMGALARQSVEAHFSSAIVARQTLDVYRQISAQAPATTGRPDA